MRLFAADVTYMAKHARQSRACSNLEAETTMLQAGGSDPGARAAKSHSSFGHLVCRLLSVYFCENGRIVVWGCAHVLDRLRRDC